MLVPDLWQRLTGIHPDLLLLKSQSRQTRALSPIQTSPTKKVSNACYTEVSKLCMWSRTLSSILPNSVFGRHWLLFSVLSYFEAVCPSVVPAWLEHIILLLQPPECQDYSCVPCLAFGKLHYLRKLPSFLSE